MTWGELAAVIAVITSVVTVYIAWKKLKPEKRVLNSEAEEKTANAARTYQEMLEKSAERERILMTRIEALELRQTQLERKLEAAERELAETKKTLEEWKNYADRLAHQLRSRNLIPVPFSLERKTRPPNQK